MSDAETLSIVDSARLLRADIPQFLSEFTQQYDNMASETDNGDALYNLVQTPAPAALLKTLKDNSVNKIEVPDMSNMSAGERVKAVLLSGHKALIDNNIPPPDLDLYIKANDIMHSNGVGLDEAIDIARAREPISVSNDELQPPNDMPDWYPHKGWNRHFSASQEQDNSQDENTQETNAQDENICNSDNIGGKKRVMAGFFDLDAIAYAGVGASIGGYKEFVWRRPDWDSIKDGFMDHPSQPHMAVFDAVTNTTEIGTMARFKMGAGWNPSVGVEGLYSTVGADQLQGWAVNGEIGFNWIAVGAGKPLHMDGAVLSGELAISPSVFSSDVNVDYTFVKPVYENNSCPDDIGYDYDF